MIEAWRLDRAKRSQAESFSGDGAAVGGGRWNRREIRAVYASDSLALAALEKFVNTQKDGRYAALVSYRIVIPSSVSIDRPRIDQLPRNWRVQPFPPETQDFGTAWLRKCLKAVLFVPSTVVPSECNLLLNPEHPDFIKIKILSRERFAFDSRMWKQE